MSTKKVKVGNIDCGADQLFLISGPCVIEEESIMMRTAEKLKEVSAKLSIPVIYKSSFSKDNRSSLKYYNGPGLDQGMRILAKVKEQSVSYTHLRAHETGRNLVCRLLL